jgi:WD40 repeat protein
LFLNRGREHKTLEVWDWSTVKSSVALQEHFGQLESLGFSANGALLATGWSDGAIALLDTKECRPLGTMAATGVAIVSLAFSPSGRFIASGGKDWAARVWDVNTQQQLDVLGGNDDTVTGVAFTPDEKSLITLTGDGTIKVWNFHAVLERGVLWTTTNTLEGFNVSADQRVMATKNSTGALLICDLASGAEIRRIQPGEIQPGEPNRTAASFDFVFSPTDHVVAWTGWSSFGVADYDSGKVTTFRLPRYGYCNPAFSPDGREVFFACPTNVMVWEIATGKPRHFAPTEHLVWALAVSPNGSLLATAHEGGEVTLWDRALRREIANVPAHATTAFDVMFSPNGRLLASAGLDGTGKLWEVIPGGLKLRHILRGHAGFPSMVFSPDGGRIVSSSGGDEALRLWDTKTGLEVGRIYGPHGGFAGFAFSRDGNSIYAATRGGEVRIWHAPPLEQLESPVKAKKVRQ